MKIVNLIQKLGLMLTLLVMANHAVAATYDLRGAGEYYIEDDQVFYEYYTSSTLESFGPFKDSFVFTAPEGEVWSFSALAENWDGMTDEFTEILFQDISGEVSYMYAGIGSNLWGWGSSGSEIIIGPGDYSVSVSGLSAMPNAEYGMNIFLMSTVSPVPEPSSIALMFGGLGLVGFMAAAARRRQQA